ncbi:acetyl-CoA carboxylase biotin carboxylase subunit family protein [Pseudonocardia sp. ICBG1293]|uniref:ATP-grasp domain-containing protein n=1 Tax=Pseudonocardia sp. ICBG1293 TaxID=2844382 RepID=UPI001CC96C89|nr:ATP-grasp domain-containing protein [Pseudonocardia sp. ICBG1293]
MAIDPKLRISLITEADCLSVYPPMEAVEIVQDVQNLDEVRQAALKLGSHRDFAAIVAPGESSIPTGGYLRSYFGMAGMSFDVAHAFCNKHAMKNRLRAAGVPVADDRLAETSQVLRERVLENGFPAVVKPVWSDGAAHVHVVRDNGELDALTRSDSPFLREQSAPFLVEEFVQFDEEFHCDGLVYDGEVVFVASSQYIRPTLNAFGRTYGSFTLPSSSPHTYALRELHRRAVAALGLQNSVTHMEAFRTKDGFMVGEIACRPGGGVVPRQMLDAYGFDTWRHFMATELNEQIEWSPRVSPGVWLTVQFPLRRGTVRSVPDCNIFEDVPAVIDTEVRVRPGQCIDGTLYASSMSGMSHCHLSSIEEVEPLIELLETRFTVEYER